MKCCNRKDKGQTMICKTIYIHRNIEQHEPHYKPAIFTTMPNLQDRYHVNKLWLWVEPDVRKISMSMLENCVFHNLLINDCLHLQLHHGVNSEYVVTVYHKVSTIWAIALCERVEYLCLLCTKRKPRRFYSAR
jgi:hypothetical protein